MHRIRSITVLIAILVSMAVPALAQDRSATGSLTTTGDSVTVMTQGMATLTVYVTGTFSQTDTPQVSPDGTNWITAPITPVLPGATAVSTITAAGQWQVSVAGYRMFRLYGTTIVSGTAVVWLEASQSNSSVASGGSGGGGGSVTQGTSPWVVSFASTDLVVGPTSVTSATTVVSITIAGYYGVGVNITSAGSTCTQVAQFSTDGGTTWTTTQLYNANTQALSASTTTTGQYGIVIPGGTSNVRMLVSVYGSGTVTDQLRATALGNPVNTVQGTITANAGTNLNTSALALESGNLATIVTNTGHLTDNTQTTRVTDGTTTANIAPATGSQTGQGALQVAATYQTVAASFSSAAAGTSFDCASYRNVSIQNLTNAGTNTITFQTSNDNTNWVSLSLSQSDAPVTQNTNELTASVRMWSGPITGRYFRLNCTNYISGTTTLQVVFSTLPMTPTGVLAGASEVGTWTVQPGNTPNTSAWLTQQTAAAAGGWSSSHISTNSTTTVKSGAGVLAGIFIGTPGATDTITIYDNTAGSGTVLSVINDGTSSANMLTFPSPGIAFSTGLTLVVAGTTAPDITVSYK